MVQGCPLDQGQRQDDPGTHLTDLEVRAQEVDPENSARKTDPQGTAQVTAQEEFEPVVDLR